MDYIDIETVERENNTFVVVSIELDYQELPTGGCVIDEVCYTAHFNHKTGDVKTAAFVLNDSLDF